MKHLPGDWITYGNSDITEIHSSSSLYNSLKNEICNYSFCLAVTKIERVENKHLYSQYLIKKEEYKARGCLTELKLYHDTAQDNIPSIVRTNLDYRRVHRAKYGTGVSFSPYPAYANKQSARSNGKLRAMIVADVLIGNQEHVRYGSILPSNSYDTTVGGYNNVYVKYFDNEFYPKYIISYIN